MIQETKAEATSAFDDLASEVIYHLFYNIQLVYKPVHCGRGLQKGEHTRRRDTLGATLGAGCRSLPFCDTFERAIDLRSEKPAKRHISNYSRRDAG